MMDTQSQNPHMPPELLTLLEDARQQVDAVRRDPNADSYDRAAAFVRHQTIIECGIALSLGVDTALDGAHATRERDAA